MAVTIGLYLHMSDTTPKQAFGLVLGTTIGLWLACLFADWLAQSITVSNKSERNHAYHHAFDASLGILIASRMPLLLLGFLALGWVSLSSAMLATIGAIIIQLVLFSLLSLYHRESGLLANLLTLGLQAVFFVLIIVLKIGH
ncbi:MAG: hypothetical protein Q4B81_05520 [Moraxella sp.]|nr:hypothetical protein [Moraxella sp.]